MSVHHTDVIMSLIASQITNLTIVYSTVYSDADQWKHQTYAPLTFVQGIHRDQWLPRTRASNAENVSIWWRHHATIVFPMFDITHTPCIGQILTRHRFLTNLPFSRWRWSVTNDQNPIKISMIDTDHHTYIMCEIWNKLQKINDKYFV